MEQRITTMDGITITRTDQKIPRHTSVEEFTNAVETKNIKEIYWCGGEPLMWDIHWKAMQRIIELGFAKEVYVRYNTNLSRTSLKGIKLFDLLPQFQDWQVCSSLDGTGEVGEYIRDGSETTSNG